ncbi:MAG TPA: sigma-70 family RNA polymerase sigma factor [Phycisphaerae bacterium]|nr:sigma-70 family RNA polymerase sigma factor [Phycisphaerae bacterium]
MNPEEAKQLFYRHVWPLRALVLRTARYLTRDAAEAEDLAQETLLKAYRSIATFDVSTQATAWLTAILRNTRIDRARANRRESGDVSLDAFAHGAQDRSDRTSPVDLADVAALLDRLSDEQIIDALRDLPDDIRWTLLLVNVEQLDHAQAAAIMGVPVGTVKSRAHRGRQMLRDKLLGTRTPQKHQSDGG